MRKIGLDELVIAVPKISLDRVSKRCPRPRTRRADRLVEVPTIFSYSSLQQRTSDQIIEIPVPQARGGRGGYGGLQGVSKLQGSTALCGDGVQRVRPLLRTFVLVPRMSRFQGFFALFPI